MRIFIPPLVFGLAALWPQTACAEHEHGNTEQPPVITMKWSGLVPAINLVRDLGDALSSASNPLLLIVIVKGESIDREKYLVILSAGHEARAEAETTSGVAVFSLPVDFPLQRNLTIQVNSTSYSASLQTIPLVQFEPDLIPNALARAEEEEWNFVYRPRVRPQQQKPCFPSGWCICGFPIEPEPAPLVQIVEIIVVPATDAARLKELPGFAAKFASRPKASNVLQRFTMDLIPTTDLASCFWNMESGDAYFTRPFSLKSPGTKISRSQPLPGPVSNRQPLDGCLLTDRELAFGTTDIQPVEWRKGKSGDSINPEVCDESQLLVPLDEQNPEVIIIRNSETKKPESNTPEPFEFWPVF